MYIHGGRDIKEGPMSNMWRLNISKVSELIDDPDYEVSWEPVNCKGHLPGNISFHKAEVFGSNVLIFGGIIENDNANDAYEFDSNKLVWSKLKQTGDVPKPRDDHAIAKTDD